MINNYYEVYYNNDYIDLKTVKNEFVFVIILQIYTILLF